MRLLAIFLVLVSLPAAAIVALTVDFSSITQLASPTFDGGQSASTAPSTTTAPGRAPRARSTTPDGDQAEPRPEPEPKPDPAPQPGGQADQAEGGSRAEGGSAGGSALRAIVSGVLAIGGGLLLLTALAGGAVVAARTASRRRRQVVRYRLVPFRADEVTPEMVGRLFESWHQQLLERWRSRPLGGQPSLAVETLMEPDGQGGLEGRLVIAMPRELVSAVEGSLRACYPNCRLEPRHEPPPAPAAIVRLKKRASFIQTLRIPEEDDPIVTDAVLGAMAQTDAPCVVQITLTPTPALFDRYARGRFRARERRAMRARGLDRADPGMGSELLARELEAGLSVQHRTLHFADIRIGGPTREACKAIGGALRGETAGENRLHERHLSKPGRYDLYVERMRRAWANPLPSWRRGVYASSELAGLWCLPSPGLTAVAVTRSAVPRVDAPPEVSRDPGHGILRDERGPVGILSQDKSDGLGLIGGQKTGKTSVLCQTVRVDAEDPDCAVIVLMPKPGDARKALAAVPAWRTVHYLDFEAPEFGINPLLAVGDVAMVADKVVEAFRDVNMEGDIRGSSDRYLRQAAQAAIGASRAGAIDGMPTLWHMYRMLLPGETVFREHVVRSIYGDPRFADTATFFGRDLPNDLRDAAVNTTSKLDAPRNKILRLIVESLDKVLRHPRQLDLDSVVRNREVLIVDGKMGTFGSDNCRVMMQFILNMLYGTLQRQQQLPEGERVRVAVKVDEAHLIVNESFADALATLRSAGLEIVAAWQYGEQIQDPKIRAGMMSLLRQRCMFSMGETQDARAMSELTMSVYSDVIRPDREARSRMRVAPDTIINLPNHHAVCSWISSGARVPAFVAQTIPLPDAPAMEATHLEAQRARGGYVPERLPDPLPDVSTDTEVDRALALAVGVGAEPAEVVAAAPAAPAPAVPAVPAVPAAPPEASEVVPAAAAEGRTLGEPVAGGEHGAGGARQAPPAPAAPEVSGVEPAAAVEDRTLAAPELAEATPAPAAAPRAAAASGGDADAPVPESYLELDLDEVRGLDWEDVDVLPGGARHEPSERELEILAALWRCRVLFARQVWRRWWGGSTLRSAQLGLQKMARAGWIRPCRFAMRQRGSQQRMYVLTQAGFELAQQRANRHGSYVDPQLEWREPQLNDPRRLVRDLHVNAWVLALEQLAGSAFGNWRGPREAKLRPPRRRVRGEWLDLRPEDVVVGTSRQLDGLASGPFEAVTPGAAVELRLRVQGEPLRLDLLVDVERGRGGAAREAKLQRYDALLTGWARMLDRYQMLGRPPVVVLVAEDEPSALSILRLADRLMTGRLAKAGEGEVEWPHPGRRALFVAIERDIHLGSLAAYQLPPLPPELRERVDGRGAAALQPRRVELVEARLLRPR